MSDLYRWILLEPATPAYSTPSVLRTCNILFSYRGITHYDSDKEHDELGHQDLLMSTEIHFITLIEYQGQHISRLSTGRGMHHLVSPSRHSRRTTHVSLSMNTQITRNASSLFLTPRDSLTVSLDCRMSICKRLSEPKSYAILVID
jgi:hypothetical protein